ncbi:MAG: two-component sensor histidine kinase [Burkholderiaceae bacterium]|nr:two-component sensor histidine kinase [Burkholderiaceae bacterium]
MSGKKGQSYSILRTFAVWAVLSIAVLAAIAAYQMNRFVAERMLRHDAHITGEAMTALIVTPKAVRAMLGDGSEATRREFLEQIRLLSSMPHVLRANVYDRAQRVLWSSDPRLVGHIPGKNDELDEALQGKLVMHRGRTDGSDLEKPEHRYLAQSIGEFVETYVPIRDSQGQVVGAVELYRIPVELFATLKEGTILIGIGALIGAAALFAALFWVVRNGDRTLRWQHERLVESSRLAAVGEMAASVAHGIRNPLASIRSSAELALETDALDLRREAHDIISSVDRAERWVADLLRCAVPPDGDESQASADAALATSTAFDQYRDEFTRRGIHARLAVAPRLPRVAGSTQGLAQVLAGLLANAAEATPAGAGVRVSAQPQGRGVRIEIIDEGGGIPPGDLERVFEPYVTTKARGLGLGLPLARTSVERVGGRIALASSPGHGTTVTIDLPATEEPTESMSANAPHPREART